MTTNPQPQPGQYWRDTHSQLRRVELTSGDQIVVINDHGLYSVWTTGWVDKHWFHEPDCTGFDWVSASTPPQSDAEVIEALESKCNVVVWMSADLRVKINAVIEIAKRVVSDDAAVKYPRWYVSNSRVVDAVCHRRDSETRTVGIRADGTEYAWSYDWREYENQNFAEISKEQAEALLAPEQSAANLTPIRLWVHRDSRNDDRYNVFAKISEPQPLELYFEIKPGSNGGWCVEVPK